METQTTEYKANLVLSEAIAFIAKKQHCSEQMVVWALENKHPKIVEQLIELIVLGIKAVK